MKNSLRVQRAIREISQEELADAIGVARQTINAIEIRKYIPSGFIMLKLAKYFGKPVEEIFWLEEGEYEIPGSQDPTPGKIANH